MASQYGGGNKMAVLLLLKLLTAAISIRGGEICRLLASLDGVVEDVSVTERKKKEKNYTHIT